MEGENGASNGRLTRPAGVLVLFVLLLAGCEDGPSEEGDEVEDEDVQIVGTDTLNLRLPTGNNALFRDDGPAFYQYTNRTFEGRRSTPWQAGQYGFVRNPVRTDQGIVYVRHHEGIDIKPLHRDASDQAQDTVHTIDGGTVVYVNRSPGRSNYGNYVVVRHRWSGSPYYSLYAHLRETDVKTEQEVQQGAPVGIMGHTGSGLTPDRAHVHLEIGMLLNRHFQAWFEEHFPPSANNWHGMYSGLNLASFDPAELFKALREGEVKTIEAFIQEQEPFYRVLVPGPEPPDLVRRYEGLLQEEAPARATSWEVTLDEASVPLRVAPSDSTVAHPIATWAKPITGDYRYRAQGYLTETEGRVMLTQKGRRYADLLTARTDSSST